VSLYSANQVLIGSTPVTVGANPAAVAAYSTGSIRQTFNTQCVQSTTTVTGTTRAIVANSGSDTVSIVDILHNTLLFTVTVGNHPVALAVSSDGSTAYVANYGDSTVTKVNLNTETPTGTIGVGGQPTSVALTSAGILWVGGAGFLTEINAQTMSVVGTETVSDKAIIALSFSDSLNELVATSVNTSGSVYADEINPSTFQGGSAYAPLASHAVSNLPLHLNPMTHTQVQSYTSTLTGTTGISANQVGAPPLVVQDGWAVVTATPTGFTITDASGHLVLVSETTPSPITAIAVDTKLNAAYLTMPDSNTLLTVPLPGIN
jgi:YVTN family beta-propeller protein